MSAQRWNSSFWGHRATKYIVHSTTISVVKMRAGVHTPERQLLETVRCPGYNLKLSRLPCWQSWFSLSNEMHRRYSWNLRYCDLFPWYTSRGKSRKLKVYHTSKCDINHISKTKKSRLKGLRAYIAIYSHISRYMRFNWKPKKVY